MSRGKIGPSRSYRRDGPTYLHPATAPLEGVSSRRTFGILISARGLLGCAFRCYGWGPRGEIGVCRRAWRCPRRPKKELEWPPNGLERGARRGRTLCPGTAARYAAAIPAIAHTQQAISRAVAQLATHGLLPAAAMASLRSISLRLHFAAWRRTAGATSCPGARGFGSREDAGTCHEANDGALGNRAGRIAGESALLRRPARRQPCSWRSAAPRATSLLAYRFSWNHLSWGGRPTARLHVVREVLLQALYDLIHKSKSLYIRLSE